ncbi:multifunctional protein [Miscanthus yellow fleck virus]|uniref:Multifunctional protein n=1 Tax=Miscanthus yellow fleck virus TaxID=2777538 RepID=A0A7L8YSC5_9VIRU|nr:multifunctional protein [Miscanthus yellow fleck virus]
MTLKGNGWIIALVLLLLSFPYCACTKPLWDEKKYTAIDSTSSQPLFGWLDTNATVEYQPSDIVSQYIRNKSPNHFSELSYASMFGWIFLKMKVDLQKALSEVPMCLEQFSEFIFDNMKDTSILFLNNLLWIIIKAYMYVVYTSLYWIGRVFLALWKPLSAASVVLGISTGIYKIILKVYSAIPVFWIFLPITLPVKMSLTIKERLFRKNGDEKMVAGFKSFSVPMTPPGHAVLEIIAQDNSHVGYASCIRLKNGEEALLTSAHCCDGDYKVRSFRNGSKIPISEFLMILPAAKIDAVILRGPPEWKSLLGAKAAHFTPANQLNKGPVSLYSYDGDWKMHNAKVVGTDGKFITVLSNTEAGFSGTPYWNGKSIVGVHKGHVFGDDSKNYNLMSPIPPVKGLTAPNFVYESPSLQGDVYKDDDIDELADYAEQVYEKTLANPALWKPKSGKSWWEMVEEEEGLESSKLQGNDQRGPDHVEKPESTPVKQEESTKELLHDIVVQLVQKMDLSAITQRVEERLLEKATVQNKPQKKRGGKKSLNKPSILNNSSNPPIPGKKPQAPSQVSGKSENSQRYIIPQNRKTQNGGSASSQNIQKWRRKSPDSVGQNLVMKPKKQV